MVNNCPKIMIKVIIFDLGNVIVNVNKTKQFKRFSADSNKSISYIKNYFENSYLRKAFERGGFNSEEFYDKVSNGLNLKMNFNNFKEAWCNIFSINKTIEKLIRTLKSDFKLVLLSNTDEMHFEYIKNKYKIVNEFDEYTLSYKVGYRKPNPIIFLNAIIKANTLPFNCIYFDDIPEFVYVARLMGIRAFQYKNFERLVDDLSKLKIL